MCSVYIYKWLQLWPSWQDVGGVQLPVKVRENVWGCSSFFGPDTAYLENKRGVPNIKTRFSYDCEGLMKIFPKVSSSALEPSPSWKDPHNVSQSTARYPFGPCTVQYKYHDCIMVSYRPNLSSTYSSRPSFLWRIILLPLVNCSCCRPTELYCIAPIFHEHEDNKLFITDVGIKCGTGIGANMLSSFDH